jgi:hypothetical protein
VINMEIVVLWDVTLHTFVYRYQCFGETCYLLKKFYHLLLSLTFDCAFPLTKQPILGSQSPVSRRIKLKLILKK